MITQLIEFLEGIVDSFGVWGVFIASFTEEIIAFLPSPLVMTGTGFFVLEGDFSLDYLFSLFFMVAIPYAIGVTIASLVFYGLFYRFGDDAVKRWGKWFGVSQSNMEDLKNRMDKTRWDEATLFFLRVVPLVPSAALASICGFIKMNLRTYIPITLAGVTVRASIFASLGWYLGETYRKYAEVIAGVESILGYIFIFVVFIFVVFLFLYTQYRSKNVL